MKNGKKLTIVLVGILCLNFFILASAEAISLTDNRSENVETAPGTPFFKAIWQDEKAIWSSPFRFSGKDWLTVGGLTLVTAFLIHNDERIYSNVKDYQRSHKWVDWLSPKITLLGDGNVSLGVCGIFYLSGLLFDDFKARETARLGLMSLVHVGVVVQMWKHLFGRQRPMADQGRDRWAGPAGFFKRYKNNQDALYDAFPSGHTITVWSTATLIAKMYNRSPLVPILCYSLATLSGLSRISEDAHWLSDVLIGAVLGYAITNYVIKKRRRRVQIQPVLGKDRLGIGFSYNPFRD